jgi:6-phosphogluconolactonase
MMMTRCRPRLASGLALLGAAWALIASAGCAPVRPPVPPPPATTRLTVYVGTYTDGGSRGIYRFEFDPTSGASSNPVLAVESENPSFLALHPNGQVLYAVNELGAFGGATTGAVSAFAIDSATGNLTRLGQQPSGGADPCHLAVDRAGRNVLVANYSGGSVAVLPIGAGGGLLPATTVLRHDGSGPDRARQEGPHAHAVALDGAERFALAADLGADRIFVYRFNAAIGGLVPNDPAAVALEQGSGPRHLAWHPSGAFLYAINELRSTVTAFRYDAARGVPVSFQTVTTLPDGFSGKNKAAEVVVSPDGRFLYGSNRGDDSIAVFTIDAASGALTAAGHVRTGGNTPRHFAIDPSGRWLLVANQDSGSIVVFHLDPATGRPDPVGRPLALSKPVCILFAPPPG